MEVALAELEETSKRQQTALAAAAHELRTPLTIIAGYVDLLLTRKAGPLNEKQEQILGEVRTNGERLSRVVQDFLTFAAMDNGGAALTLEIADLNRSVAEICDSWSRRFHESGVGLHMLGCTTLKPFAFDVYKVQHVVSNLLDNALKFTTEGGTVSVTLQPHTWDRRRQRFARKSAERRQQQSQGIETVLVRVADTGCGIEPEFHLEIFEDFFRVDSPHSRRRGFGLGLGIARRLVTAFGGKIWVESEVEKGSQFCFLVPIRQDCTDAGKGDVKGQRDGNAG